MICKIKTINYTKNALEYCEKGGELIHSNFVFGTSKEINRDMLELQERNKRTEKKGIHAILSFNPDDNLDSFTQQDYIELSEKYAKKHGFEDNQYAVYLHNDKSHIHLHIVANRIGFDNKSVSSSQSFPKNTEFSMETEIEYNLIRTNRKLSKKEVLENSISYPEFESSNIRLDYIKKQIDKEVLNSNSIDDLKEQLKKYNIKTYIGRGVTFVDGMGAKFKGSQIGREYSLQGLTKQINSKTSIEIIKNDNIEFSNDLLEEQKNNDMNSSTLNIEPNNLDLPNVLPLGKLSKNEDDEDMPKKRKRKGRNR